ncbi:MAG: hypothetical protein L6M37_04930 [Candidatus Methylarchaceae archaeon HK02M1]|nr:hypothetical protein [Candidatus Methylarchaceae archaeon HK02M1]
MSRFEEKPEEGESLLETLDDLIFHMNDARITFIILSISSLIIAPIAIIMAMVFTVNPAFLRWLLNRNLFFGLIFLFYIILVMILSSIWLFVGLREYRFLSKWNERFKKYISLKERVDKELQKELE